MVAMAVCNLCGGNGFIQFFHGDGDPLEDFGDPRRCPACQGGGAIEPWLQAATGVHNHEAWMNAPSWLDYGAQP